MRKEQRLVEPRMLFHETELTPLEWDEPVRPAFFLWSELILESAGTQEGQQRTARASLIISPASRREQRPAQRAVSFFIHHHLHHLILLCFSHGRQPIGV